MLARPRRGCDLHAPHIARGSQMAQPTSTLSGGRLRAAHVCRRTAEQCVRLTGHERRQADDASAPSTRAWVLLQCADARVLLLACSQVCQVGVVSSTRCHPEARAREKRRETARRARLGRPFGSCTRARDGCRGSAVSATAAVRAQPRIGQSRQDGRKQDKQGQWREKVNREGFGSTGPCEGPAPGVVASCRPRARQKPGAQCAAAGCRGARSAGRPLVGILIS